MTRRTKFWLAAAVLFEIVNLGGAGYAVALSEMPHAGLHVALALLGAWPVWRLASRRGNADGAQVQGEGEGEGAGADGRSAVAERLLRVEQSIDAVALEVERIGEGQRYLTRLLSDSGDPARGERLADRVEAKAPFPTDGGV